MFDRLGKKSEKTSEGVASTRPACTSQGYKLCFFKFISDLFLQKLAKISSSPKRAGHWLNIKCYNMTKVKRGLWLVNYPFTINFADGRMMRKARVY